MSQGQNLSLVATAPNVDVSFMTLSESSPLENMDSNLQQHGMNETSLQSFISLLPRNLHVDKQRKIKEGENINNEQSQSIQDIELSKNEPLSSSSMIQTNEFTIIEEEEEFDDDEDHNDDKESSDEKGDALLQNAWQYKVSVQKERLGQTPSLIPSRSSASSTGNGKREYCHSYDLSGKMEDQYNAEKSNITKEGLGISIVNCICQNCPLLRCENRTSCGVNLFKMLVNHILEIMNKQENGVIRLLLMNASVQTTSIALPLLLTYIRSHSLPVVIMVTVRPWTTQPKGVQQLISLRRTCDAVFTCEGFDAVVTPPPPEFSDLAGIFSIRKMSLQSLAHFADSTTNRRPPANRFGMKRDRRKLHIKMLHLPPEDFSAGGSSVGSGVRSGGGRPTQQQQDNKNERTTALQPGLSCSSNMRGKSSSHNVSLDF